jgi:hypothetical protein
MYTCIHIMRALCLAVLDHIKKYICKMNTTMFSSHAPMSCENMHNCGFRTGTNISSGRRRLSQSSRGILLFACLHAYMWTDSLAWTYCAAPCCAHSRSPTQTKATYLLPWWHQDFRGPPTTLHGSACSTREQRTLACAPSAIYLQIVCICGECG